jgi:uncharacterized membrane protein (DUF106 family)
VSLLNALLARSFDLLLAPFRQLPPIVGLGAASLVTAVAMLLVFKRTSDQKRLAAVKRQIHAAIFEIRLFNDDMRAIFRAQGEILRHNLTYLRLSLVPMLWMILPLVLVIAQLQFHYGYDGLAPGEAVLLKAQVREGVALSSLPSPGVALASTADRREVAALELPAQIEAQTPAVWIPATREVIWRITPREPGEYELRLRVGGESFTKSVRVSSDVVRRSPVRLGGSFLNQLLYPAEAPLPGGSAIASISLGYPERDVRILGWGVHWMIVYFVLSMVIAFALRKRFNVTL